MLFNAGDHIPVIALGLFELVGNGIKISPAQIEGTCVNVGAIIGFTVINIVAVEAHCPVVGVNV